MTEREFAAAAQLARRLHEELRGVLALLPEPERAASAMSRALNIDRATCQRIVQALAVRDAGPEMLVSLPGVQGLRTFLRSVQSRELGEVGRERLAGARAAVDLFETLLDELGVSQRKLRERLFVRTAKPEPTHAANDDATAREALYKSALNIVGRWSQLNLHTSIIRPVPDRPELTEWVRLRGLIGHTWRDVAVPLELGGTASLQRDVRGASMNTLDTHPASGSTQASLIPRFCSSPLPRVTARTAGRRVVSVIDAGAHDGNGPTDIVMAHRSANPDPHPATLDPALGEVWVLQHVPARRLVFDTFLHRDIARRCLPSLEMHMFMPDVGQHAAARWSTRFPGGPRLEMLGPGIRNAPIPVYDRYSDLLSHVFTEVAWNPDEYVGYRCDVPFPVWRAGYCMIFDFAPPPEG